MRSVGAGIAEHAVQPLQPLRTVEPNGTAHGFDVVCVDLSPRRDQIGAWSRV